MATKVYVGNLNFSTTDDRLSETFGQYGPVVSANVVTDRYTQQSRGFGFVEMEEQSDAEAAISALNGQELDGRNLKVAVASDKPRDNNRRF